MSAQCYAVVVVHATIGLDQSSAEVLLTSTLFGCHLSIVTAIFKCNWLCQFTPWSFVLLLPILSLLEA